MEVLPPSTANLLVQAASPVVPTSREERQHDLLLHQMIRATVEEGGQEKALLQFGDRRLWVETGTPLKAGDTLNLQVVETQPNLSFKIIEASLLERLGHSLHLLGNRFDAMSLLPAMLEGREPGSKSLNPQVRDGLTQLLSLLKKTPETLDGATLSALPKQLGLYHEANLLAERPQVAAADLKNALGQLEIGQKQLSEQLKSHLQPLSGVLSRLAEFIQPPGQPAATLQQLPEPLAAALRPLLRLAQSLPEPSTSTPLTGTPAPAVPTTSSPQPGQEAVQALVRALGEYLQPTEPLTPQTLSRLEQQLSPLPQLLQSAGTTEMTAGNSPARPDDLLGSLVRLLQGTPAQSTAATPETLAKQLATALQTAIAPPAATRESQPATQPSPALRQLAQVLAEIPTVIRQSGQTGPFLERQPAEIASILRPILQMAATPAETSTATTPPAPVTQATTASTLSPQDIDQTTTEFIQALRNYLKPFDELTSNSLDRLERQAALLLQIQQGPFEAALAAIGQKPQGKDLLSALFHLLRTAPDKLQGSRGEALGQQIAETLQKALDQGLEHIVERQEETLRQVELWQLCRARLGDINTSFIPLPLPFLENGFLIGRRQQSPDQETGQPEEIVTLSLFLDLQKLGPLQVDLLYQKKELFIRFKCQTQDAADTLSAAQGELGAALADFPQTSISVGLGAESPDRALIRTLIPPEKTLLDTRI